VAIGIIRQLIAFARIWPESEFFHVALRLVSWLSLVGLVCVFPRAKFLLIAALKELISFQREKCDDFRYA